MSSSNILFLLILSILAATNNLSAKNTSKWAQQPLTINVFALNNGGGQENGRTTLREALENLGYTVFERGRYDPIRNAASHVDINIFCEKISSKWLPYASYNWFIPNPEWYTETAKILDKIDLILCRTHDSERIFQGLGKKTFYLGFTSRDCLQKHIKKDFSSCLHLIGRSSYKGTPSTLTAWRGFLFMPKLTVAIQPTEYNQCINTPLIQENVVWIPEKIPFEDLIVMQNSCGIHLCASEVEGYGHYIVEAMSAEAVVITTDAPPMNELIADKRCLISYTNSSPIRLGTQYIPDPQELREKIIYLQSLPRETLIEIGKNNRNTYLKNQQAFHQNLKTLMECNGPHFLDH